MTRIEFRVLGALEIEADGRSAALRGGRNRALLATLLLDADQVVPVPRLVEAVWDGDPPGTAHKAVRNGMWSLRSWLEEVRGRKRETPAAAALIETDPSGYRLRLAGDAALDAERFGRQVAQARVLAAAGQAVQAVTGLRAGLALWRGPAFAGFTSRVLTAGAARLDELRLAALEQCLDLELTLGRHRDLISELRGLVDEWPLREGMVGRLMIALYRSGRRADALGVFERFRDRLAADLGLDPTADLRRLHQTVLRADPEPGTAAPWGPAADAPVETPISLARPIARQHSGAARTNGTTTLIRQGPPKASPAPETPLPAPDPPTPGVPTTKSAATPRPGPVADDRPTAGPMATQLPAGSGRPGPTPPTDSPMPAKSLKPGHLAPVTPLPTQPLAASTPSPAQLPPTASTPAQPSPSSALMSATAIPAQLPPASPTLVARAEHLTTLDALIGDPRTGRAAPPVVVTGAAGVGKSALTVHWAHLRQPRFPDGRLHADLSPAPGRPARPADVLVSFLRSLGVDPDRVPSADHPGLFRTLVNGRRILVILDGAVSAEQVRPLLPGGPTARVLITSRDELRGLTAVDGARRLELPRLSRAQSIDLLRRLTGTERVADEPGSARLLADRCAGLPLALRIAAARLADPRFGTLAALAAALGDPPDLDVLSFTEDDAASLRVVFSGSYLALGPPDREVFRRLSLLPSRTAFSVTEAVAVLGDGPEVAERQVRQSLDRLACLHLLERESADTYTLHDLLRAYASEWHAAEDPLPG